MSENLSARLPRAARDQTLVRRVNELAVMQALRGAPALTLSELSELTGQSWRTTSVVAESLSTHGWLLELDAGEPGPRRGRPARRFRFNARAGHVLGLDIGLEHVAAMIADLEGSQVAFVRTDVDPTTDRDERVDIAVRTAEKVLDAAGLGAADLWATAAGTVGIVTESGRVSLSSPMPHWTGVDLAAVLSERLGCSVAVENDCNLATLAELWRGPTPPDVTMLYVLASTRLSTGILINGRLHRGHTGAAGEIGAMKEFGWDTAPGLLLQASPDGDPMQVFDAARHGEATALEAVETFTGSLARGLAAMVLTIDPERIVIGGTFSVAHDLLAPRLRAHLSQTCLSVPTIEASSAGDQPVTVGAVRAALDLIDNRLARLEPGRPLAISAIQTDPAAQTTLAN